MTISEPTDPTRFCRTRKRGLTPQPQPMIDAFIYDQLGELLRDGGEPLPKQRQIWLEL